MLKIFFFFAVLYLIVKAARNLIRAALQDVLAGQVPPADPSEPTISNPSQPRGPDAFPEPIRPRDIEDARFEDLS